MIQRYSAILTFHCSLHHSGMYCFLTLYLLFVCCQLNALNASIYGSVDHGLAMIDAAFERHDDVNTSELARQLARSREHAQTVVSETRRVHERAHRVNFTMYTATADEYELYRWLAALVYFGWMTLICLLLLLAIACSSKCTLLWYVSRTPVARVAVTCAQTIYVPVT